MLFQGKDADTHTGKNVQHPQCSVSTDTSEQQVRQFGQNRPSRDQRLAIGLDKSLTYKMMGISMIDKGEPYTGIDDDHLVFLVFVSKSFCL